MFAVDVVGCGVSLLGEIWTFTTALFPNGACVWKYEGTPYRRTELARLGSVRAGGGNIHGVMQSAASSGVALGVEGQRAGNCAVSPFRITCV